MAESSATSLSGAWFAEGAPTHVCISPLMKRRRPSMRCEAAFRPTGFQKSSQWLTQPPAEN